jgi:hypothetical protein
MDSSAWERGLPSSAIREVEVLKVSGVIWLAISRFLL